jgi:hypothetical protein
MQTCVQCFRQGSLKRNQVAQGELKGTTPEKRLCGAAKLRMGKSYHEAIIWQLFWNI